MPKECAAAAPCGFHDAGFDFPYLLPNLLLRLASTTTFFPNLLTFQSLNLQTQLIIR